MKRWREWRMRRTLDRLVAQIATHEGAWEDLKRDADETARLVTRLLHANGTLSKDQWIDLKITREP